MDQLDLPEKSKRVNADTIKRPPYVRREEILYDGKRYRLYNNYLTIGAGFLSSSIRSNSQKMIGADYQFHIKRHYFQAGASMSGAEFLSNNNIEARVGYGLRRERNTTNLALFVGPTLFTGVQGDQAVSDPSYYNGWGGYICAQAVSKFVSYDVGLGAEMFAEFSEKQTLIGFKIIVFFSGAYRGVKRNFNPNVRAENPGLK